MSEEACIQVNFGKPMPMFPLDHAALMPQQVVPLHIFEPRYRQMIDDVLDSSGQFAIGIFRGDQWKQEYHGNPAVRAAVCIAQILQHERLADGRYNLLVQGVCRARIVEEFMPDEETLYRRVVLEPVGVGSHDAQEEPLEEVRSRLAAKLAEGPLARMKAAGDVLERLENDEIPTPPLMELVTFMMLSEPELRYRLLAEGNALLRAKTIEHELGCLERLIDRAMAQHPEQWPKGCSWN